MNAELKILIENFANKLSNATYNNISYDITKNIINDIDILIPEKYKYEIITNQNTKYKNTFYDFMINNKLKNIEEFYYNRQIITNSLNDINIKLDFILNIEINNNLKLLNDCVESLYDINTLQSLFKELTKIRDILRNLKILFENINEFKLIVKQYKKMLIILNNYKNDIYNCYLLEFIENIQYSETLNNVLSMITNYINIYNDFYETLHNEFNTSEYEYYEYD